ncbi:sugar phosphate isomerase/epimerase family protein [Paenibacillus sp.]|jgi:hexulose-6-phosphate isomerase|uniref:sugar phosphate isomerase/epimerase family protein n=1 Tax=Paenibacillus sp. TaxID=58172 RepID=UPI00282C61BD|nr:sugar phosphate isomerase/epimerase family protein [Paenibacillus sp.]MDR0270710.1 sugar phosphate isomerase/epimerase [Paenibacillus sp.]
MKKGINQWCFPAGTPLGKLLRTSSAAGFETIELNLYASGGVGLTMDTTPEEAKAMARLVQSYGLAVGSLSTEMLGRHPLSSPDRETRSLGVDSIRKQIELALEMDVDTILIVPGRVEEDVTYEEVWERSRIALQPLIDDIEGTGLCIAIENVWNKFLLSPLEMARYVDQFESSHVGAYLDVGNTLAFGRPEHWIRTLGERIRRVHVKDFRTQVGNYDGFVPLLSGDVDWLNVRLALSDINYQGSLTAELEPYISFPDQLIFDTSRHLDVIMGKNPH